MSTLIGVTVFRVDSKYAIHMATGRTRPRSGPKAANRDLALRLRDEYRRLQQERGYTVRIEHVRSHTGVRGNEAADVLARRGTQIGDRDRVVELRSAEPPREMRGHLDNG